MRRRPICLALSALLLALALAGALAAAAGARPCAAGASDPLVALALQQATLTASDGATGAYFGYSVAVSGDTAVVGAYGADSETGAAYVFTRSGAVWTQQQKLTASDGALGAKFGCSVAVSGDTAVVGAWGDDSNSGAAYVFTRSASVWTQQQKLTAGAASDLANFGASVALSGDTAIVGAPGDSFIGAAYVFTRSGTVWTRLQRLTAGDGAEGFARSVAVDGGTAVVGAWSTDYLTSATTGAAYVYTCSSTGWSEQQKLTASDAAADDVFGFSVAVSGDTVAVGALYADSYAGAAYVFTRSGTAWSEQQKLTASDGAVGDDFGISVALSGDTVVVGAYLDDTSAGAAYVFARSGSAWSEQQKLTASDCAADDHFGVSVALSGDTAVIGAEGVDSQRGAAYVFGWHRCTVTPSVVGAPDGHGAISPITAQALPPGSTPTFTFAPETGYHVEAVRVDGATVTMTGVNQYTFPALAADHTISVEFALDTYVVTPGIVGAPDVHGDITPPTPQALDYGSTPTFDFTPEPGYHVEAVRVDGALVAMTGYNRYTFPALTGDHTISVEFAIDTCIVTPSVVGGASGHGTISPSAPQTLDRGSTPTFSFTPAAGYHVQAVKVDGVPVDVTGVDEYTFPPLTGDHTISVEFAVDTFTVTPSVVGGAWGHGSVDPSTPQTLPYGSTPTFAFTCEPGYHVMAVRVDGNIATMTGADEYTFPALTGDHRISVEFAADAAPAPAISGFTPVSGPVGTTVVISGSGLGGASSVGFGGASAVFVVNSATQITVTVPSNAVSGRVSVTTPGGTALSSAGFTVTVAPPRPAISALAPAGGRRGATVTLTGAGFGTLRGSSCVKFGTVRCRTYLSWSGTRITCRVPAKARLGKVNVRVVTAGGASRSMTFTVRR